MWNLKFAIVPHTSVCVWEIYIYIYMCVCVCDAMCVGKLCKNIK